MQLNKEFVAKVKPAIVDVWQYIGSDAMECCESNKEALEMCVDADRLTTCVNRKDIDDLIRDATKEHGYTKVLSLLAKNISLM